MDIVDEQAVEKGFASFAADIGGSKSIDVLVANAGYMADLGSIDSVDAQNWWAGFEINSKFTTRHRARLWFRYTMRLHDF